MNAPEVKGGVTQVQQDKSQEVGSASSGGAWRVSVIKASKGRAQRRIWVVGPNGGRAGHFPSEATAQAYADRENAAIALALGSQA